MGGCSGCRKKPDSEEEAKKKKKKEEPKPDFDIRPLLSRPHPEGAWFKPGHWTAVALPAKTNNFDFLGELRLTAVDRTGSPLPLLATAFEMTTIRQAALPKGQPKVFETLLYVPTAGVPARVQYTLRGRPGGIEAMSQPLLRMPSYQYYFVVLARWQDRYGYLAALPSTRYPADLKVKDAGDPYYRIVLLPGDRRPTLPSHALLWTSIAYVLWDDAEPQSLAPEQQRAMVDWLHWGGQLILSGPDTLDALKESFLGPYLPATSAGTRELTEADLAPLATWAVGRGKRPLAPVRPWTGVRLRKHAEAQYVPGTGQLLAERRVGRGRIVVSEFRLSGRDLISWPGWDSFFNACLLRRRPRKFHAGEMAQVQVRWAGGDSNDFENRMRMFDAAEVCPLRYFTRDTGIQMTSYGADVRMEATQELDSPVVFSETPVSDVESSSRSGPGMAAWNDFGAVANAARTAVTASARVEVPRRDFVVLVLAGYLLVLVPLNWAVFRVLGRVEWVWAAAPAIAILCTVVVIRLAQLDIGFVRSRTEIAVAELQGNYPRAHLTRYDALYSSLATRYEFQFNDPGSLWQPFPSVSSPDQFRMATGQSRRMLQHRYGEGVLLKGFAVGSNTTGLFHSEQMLDLEGPISLVRGPDEGLTVVNHTGLDLQGAGVIQKTSTGRLRGAWLGALSHRAAVPLRWLPLNEHRDGHEVWSEQRRRLPLTASDIDSAGGQLNFRDLVRLAENASDLSPGQTRLVGWVEKGLAGLTITPSPPQAHMATLIVANLEYGDGDDPRPDVNSIRDVDPTPLATPEKAE